MSYQKLIVVTWITLVFIGCQKKSFYWQGVGMGDSFIEIKDSLVAYNGMDQDVSYYIIDSLAEGSIIGHQVDNYTGLEYIDMNVKIDIDGSDITLSDRFGQLHFKKLNNNLSHRHAIDSVNLRIYTFEEVETAIYRLDSNGGISSYHPVNQAIRIKTDETKVESIFRKLEILDLDNFVPMEKMFFQVSHAPCYCLEMYYDRGKELTYCRQIHNMYITSIIDEMRK